MKLWHITTKKNLDSVSQFGLKVNRSTGKLPVVWLAEQERLAWAWLHVAKHHGMNPGSLYAVSVDIDIAHLQYRGRRVWVSYEDIPADVVKLEFGLDDFLALAD
jgi:hypothetical protein